MELRKRITNSVFVLLVLSCYLCETKFINRNDTRSKSDINDNGTATPSPNQTRNASAVTGMLLAVCRVFNFTFIVSWLLHTLHCVFYKV